MSENLLAFSFFFAFKYEAVSCYDCEKRQQNMFILWNKPVFFPPRLSGLSPFAGEDDLETLQNVKSGDWDFDPDAFANVSSEGKDFIKKLLIKTPQ